MAKVAKKAPPKNEIELNRWCIEMAIKWPLVTEYSGNAGVYSTGGGLGQHQRDADVIGRAIKIRTWVNGS